MSHKKKKDYEIIPGGIEYTRPPYDKIGSFLFTVFAVALALFAASSLAMIIAYKVCEVLKCAP